MSDIQIRPMTEADLGPVGTLAAGLVRQHHQFDNSRFLLVEPVDEGYRWFFKRELKNKAALLLVATADGEVAGYVYGTVEGRDWAKLLDEHGAIHDVFVDEKFRKQGIARKLMSAAVETFKLKHVKNIVLYSATDNANAQALFKSLGFRTTMHEMTLTQPG